MQRLYKVLFILLLIVPLAACKPSGTSEPEPSPLVGEYKLVELVDAEGQDSSDLIDHVRQQGYEVTLNLEEDGTGNMIMFTSQHDITWTETEVTINDDVMDLAYDQGILTLSSKEGPGKMVFHSLN